jgi:hypothetical protein
MAMSALPRKADIRQHDLDVRFVPQADIMQCSGQSDGRGATGEHRISGWRIAARERLLVQTKGNASVRNH